MEMMASTFEHGSSRDAVRAAELIEVGIEVLREEVAEDGALARCIDRLARVSRALPDGEPAAITATHHALAHVLAIGGAVREALEPRGQQCLETLAAAQHVLYPLARANGIVEPPPLPHERRASPRVELNVDVSFASENNFYQGFSEDISDGGLFVATYRLSPIGTAFALELTLPNGHVVRTDAVVRWVRDPRDADSEVSPGMGLQFVNLPAEDARAIGAFVEARAPLFYDE